MLQPVSTPSPLLPASGHPGPLDGPQQQPRRLHQQERGAESRHEHGGESGEQPERNVLGRAIPRHDRRAAEPPQQPAVRRERQPEQHATGDAELGNGAQIDVVRRPVAAAVEEPKCGSTRVSSM